MINTRSLFRFHLDVEDLSPDDPEVREWFALNIGKPKEDWFVKIVSPGISAVSPGQAWWAPAGITGEPSRYRFYFREEKKAVLFRLRWG